jgi:adenine-specific DNA-methyltransferase
MDKSRIYSTIDDNSYYFDQSIYTLYSEDSKVDLKTVLGILNSSLIYYYFKKTMSDGKETFPKIKKIQIEELPIKTVYDNIISKLVDQLLQLNKDLQSTTLETKREQIQAKITHYEDRINEQVYQLYGLTEDEIDKIESK